MHKDKYIVITVLVTTNSSYCHLNWLNQAETTSNCEANLVISVSQQLGQVLFKMVGK